jgi:FkbM family methyltransferase
MHKIRKTMVMSVPVNFVEPVPEYVINEVFTGEYESGLSGCCLQILDIGANVGAFSLWAVHRWPGSVVHAFEPHPDTYKVLQENTRDFPMIYCFNAAVSPSPDGILVHRGTADGESALIECARLTFREEVLLEAQSVAVPVVHPVSLPRADIVKLDVEGSEAAIVLGRDWVDTTLFLIEFQTLDNFRAIRSHLHPDFDVIGETKRPWSSLLEKQVAYREELYDDFYGTAFLLRRDHSGKLRGANHTGYPFM